jgi:hypothetical protein
MKKEIKEMIVQQESKVKFKRNTEFTKRLRDTNIQISEERGRPELDGDDKKGIKLDVTASEIKEYKRRKELWKKRQAKRL